jgi:hypothetical protein
MLAIVMPKCVGTRDMVGAATDSDSLKNPLDRIHPYERLPDSLTRHMMPEATKHSVEHGNTGPSIVATQPNEKSI